MVDYSTQERPGDLPGGDQRAPPLDISTWRNIYTTAGQLVQKCVKDQNEFG